MNKCIMLKDSLPRWQLLKVHNYEKWTLLGFQHSKNVSETWKMQTVVFTQLIFFLYFLKYVHLLLTSVHFKFVMLIRVAFPDCVLLPRITWFLLHKDSFSAETWTQGICVSIWEKSQFLVVTVWTESERKVSSKVVWLKNNSCSANLLKSCFNTMSSNFTPVWKQSQM